MSFTMWLAGVGICGSFVVRVIAGNSPGPVALVMGSGKTTKNAILADGLETFRLEVDAGGDANSVELDASITDYRLFKPETGRLALVVPFDGSEPRLALPNPTRVVECPCWLARRHSVFVRC